MEKMKMESVNMTEQNIEKIFELFPNCVTEKLDEAKSTLENKVYKKAIDFEMLKQMLSDEVIAGPEAYEFTWVGKKAAIVEANKPIRKTLRPCVEESVNWDTTENLYIEGDNLEVLKLLQNSYLGKVKMIYIDPPYNTGSDFIYNDDFKMTAEEYADESGAIDDAGNRMFVNTNSNGRFHSDWCSMIYSRLLLARNLLSDDGVIFISIDDHEQENLKKCCTEIFGEKNYVAQLVWEKKKKGAFLSKNYINMKEYILVYAKNNSSFIGLVGEVTSEQETYPCIKTTNARGIRVIKKGTLSKYKKKNYNIVENTRISSGNMELIYLDEAVVKDGILQNNVRIDSNWIYGQDTLDDYAEKGLLYITQDNYIRRIVNNKRTKMLRDLLTRVGTDGKSLDVYKYDENMNNGGWGTNEDANNELHELLNQQYLFDFSKPSRLIAKLAQSVTTKEDLVLDFFSGSATTAHAVMQLNAEDGGHRKFIMVQLPEKTDENGAAFKAGYENICEIGKERIRRAGKKIKEENPLTTQDLDVGFRVLKLDESNMSEVYYSPEEYDQKTLFTYEENIKKDRKDLDLLFGCLLDWGLPLSMPYKSESFNSYAVHNYNDGDLIACFVGNMPIEAITKVAKSEPLRVVFRDGCFASSQDKINITEIFKLYSPKTVIKVI